MEGLTDYGNGIMKTGHLLREEEYFQGQRDGAYTEYSCNGEIIAQGQYSDGEKNGEWKYKSGNYTEEGKYIIGLRDGVWKSYYPNGKLKFKGNFIQGNPDGHIFIIMKMAKQKKNRYLQNGYQGKNLEKI